LEYEKPTWHTLKWLEQQLSINVFTTNW
jgi:hypothetical protein